MTFRSLLSQIVLIITLSQSHNWSNGFHYLACVLLSPVPRPTFQYQIPPSAASTLSDAPIRIKTGASRHSDRS
ncbi:hypothetical protein BKA59DRAFT_207511 [Fusarium tricinctum]|jgi:hypothetical protein|uniref:Secreted protein n=1 Tax=Fusarium tricinctum TaxID=61284 RepID=A0A8K0W991_9HYPO|nr:hypothetical protein BKA59DRAFT_207511 [Fusarium tricinctum]